MMKKQNTLPLSRARLAAVLRVTKEVVSVDAVARILGVDRKVAAKQLSRWLNQGWLRRVGHGFYVSVPLELVGSQQVVGDPWVLVPTLFDPCYVGAWTAAHHWELTEQLFNETFVFTAKRITSKRVTAQGTAFLLHHIGQKRLFGLKSIWRGSVRVSISDPARTMIDMLAMPKTGGGIDHAADCLSAYLKSPAYDGSLLIRYGAQFGNGAIFKRLGFLAEAHLHDADLASACRSHLTQGYARLDPALPSRHLNTAWRLWLPKRWSKGVP